MVVFGLRMALPGDTLHGDTVLGGRALGGRALVPIGLDRTHLLGSSPEAI